MYVIRNFASNIWTISREIPVQNLVKIEQYQARTQTQQNKTQTVWAIRAKYCTYTTLPVASHNRIASHNFDSIMGK